MITVVSSKLVCCVSVLSIPPYISAVKFTDIPTHSIHCRLGEDCLTVILDSLPPSSEYAESQAGLLLLL